MRIWIFNQVLVRKDGPRKGGFRGPSLLRLFERGLEDEERAGNAGRFEALKDGKTDGGMGA